MTVDKLIREGCELRKDIEETIRAAGVLVMRSKNETGSRTQRVRKKFCDWLKQHDEINSSLVLHTWS